MNRSASRRERGGNGRTGRRGGDSRPARATLAPRAAALGPMLVLLATSLAAGQPTEDAAAPAPRPPQGFFEILFSGGPIGVVIMIALIGVSLTAAYLVFEQFLTLRRKELVPDGLADETRALVAAGQLAQADAKCRERPSLLSFVLLYGIGEADGGWSAVEKGLEDALAEQSARLFRRVEYLSVIGGIAPMLGLLGTVTGMIMAFEQVARTQGSAGAAELAEGIYQALVTTVVGLIIAIPSLGAFAILRNRVDEMAAEAAYQAQHALGPLKHASRYGGGPPPAPPK